MAASDVDAECAETARSDGFARFAVANTGALVIAPVNAVIAVEVDPESAEIAANATDVPVAVRKTGAVAGAPVNTVATAAVGVPVNAVSAELPVLNDAATPAVAATMFVTLPAVVLLGATPP